MTNTRCLGLSISLIAFMTLVAFPVLAQRPGGPPPPPGGAPVVCTDRQNVYALNGDKLLQYSKSDFKLVKSIDLPKPPPPPDKGGALGPGSPPRGEGPPPSEMAGHRNPPPSSGLEELQGASACPPGPPPCTSGQRGPQPPAEGSRNMSGPGGGPPPMGGPRPSLWSGDRSLFVQLGPMLYRYSTPDLRLLDTLDCGRPERPSASK